MFPEFQEHINQLLKYIKWKQAHSNAIDFIHEWLRDYYDDNIANGMSHDEAVQAAILAVGSPEKIGPELNRTYSRFHQRDVLLLIGALVVCGVFLSALQSGSIVTYLVNPLLYAGAFILGYFLDSRIFSRYNVMTNVLFTLSLGATLLLESKDVLSGVSPYIIALFPIIFSGCVRNSMDKGVPSVT